MRAGESVVHIAAQLGLHNIVQQLLGLGARVELLNKAGVSSLSLARQSGFKKVVDVCLNFEYEPGKKALEWCTSELLQHSEFLSQDPEAQHKWLQILTQFAENSPPEQVNVSLRVALATNDHVVVGTLAPHATPAGVAGCLEECAEEIRNSVAAGPHRAGG